MSYENAPATKLLATRCAVCARKLLDSKSVELGIGPDCRKRYGYDDPSIGEDARKEANAIVQRIACVQTGSAALELTRDLALLGFVKLADRISVRLTRVQIELDGDSLLVSTPYSFKIVEALKQIPGRSWLKDTKQTRIPADQASRAILHAALINAFPGVWARGPKGPFVIPAKASEAVVH